MSEIYGVEVDRYGGNDVALEGLLCMVRGAGRICTDKIAYQLRTDRTDQARRSRTFLKTYPDPRTAIVPPTMRPTPWRGILIDPVTVYNGWRKLQCSGIDIQMEYRFMASLHVSEQLDTPADP